MRTKNWRPILARALVLTSLTFAASCATQQPAPAPAPVIAPAPPPPPPPQTSAQPSHAVRASYYGEKQAGRLTASGERYDPDDLTAASRTLPIGSMVEVTNPANGKSVRVRINDRGPHVRGRSLDLSKRAADELGITEKGVARLKIRRVASSSTKREAANTPTDTSSTSSSASPP